MTVTTVRYRTTAESAEENVRLVGLVFAELAADAPAGLHYATFRLADGVSFLHVAVLDGPGNPLSSSKAFADFQSGIRDRCVDGPEAAQATVVGSYGLLPG